ncbi:hypothetical protein EV668_1321 [Enterovirga rhinocerotis]|uniref:Uncharacterized protein n=2 Tax=Enterovirga rhinocerotis TaxID=1339210 RepID=A0A4R7C647_9HYPH|nr:hypothetical protein EV668_1321 [Enterovirga rhinocerotis]
MEKLGLISRVAERFGSSGRLGKKAVQKIFHILDEGLGVNTGYTFTIYTYGAFSRDLAGDLDIASAVGGVDITYVDYDNRYIVKAGSSCEAVKYKANAYLDSVESGLDSFASLFDSSNVNHLELLSTMVFLHKRRSPNEADDSLVEKLISLKPKYRRDEAERCLTEEVKPLLQRISAPSIE